MPQHPHYIGEETKAQKERHSLTADSAGASRVVFNAVGKATSSPQGYLLSFPFFFTNFIRARG